MSDDYITIPLTKGQETIVDGIDADLAKYNWHAHNRRGKYYASRMLPTQNKQRDRVDLHTIILERKIGRCLIENELPDHKDGDSLNNRRDNLRVGTRVQNSQNRKVPTTNKSGYPGVTWHVNKWQAEITANKERFYLGVFDTLQDAIKARKEAEEKYFGEFRRKD